MALQTCFALRLVAYLITVATTSSWLSDELEMFDLVEEVNKNFYDVLGINQNADSNLIKKAYRRLLLQLHPDKSKAIDAEKAFRQLVDIYAVLKDAQKRQLYDEILLKGLPDWRSPVFYYRRVRKISFIELFIYLLFVLTFGQYLLGWAIYIEQRLTLEDINDNRRRKERKKKMRVKENEDFNEDVSSLQYPSIFSLWLFQLPAFAYWCVCSIPSLMNAICHEVTQLYLCLPERKADNGRVTCKDGKASRKPRFQKVILPDDCAMKTEVCVYSPSYCIDKYGLNDQGEADQQKDNVWQSAEWSEMEIVLLTKAVNKYPGGTPSRWEKISHMVGRQTDEVCNKAKFIKAGYIGFVKSEMQDAVHNSMAEMKQQLIGDNTTISHPNAVKHVADSGVCRHVVMECWQPTQGCMGQQEHVHRTSGAVDTAILVQSAAVDTTSCSDISGKVSTSQLDDTASDGTEIESGWSQSQQLTLEWALRNYPKDTDRRWDLIAEHIAGKTKNDCIARYRELADLVKKRKGVIQ